LSGLLNSLTSQISAYNVKVDKKPIPGISIINSTGLIFRTYTDQFKNLRRKVCRQYPSEADRLIQIHLYIHSVTDSHKGYSSNLNHKKKFNRNYAINQAKVPTDTINTVVFNDLDWETARATIVKEAEMLGRLGYTKYDEIDGVHLYRRIKI
jgi:hypothetical protein